MFVCLMARVVVVVVVVADIRVILSTHKILSILAELISIRALW